MSDILDKKFNLNIKPFKDPIYDLCYYDVITANILIVGPTGTGKTTFLKVLRNPKYITHMSIDSQTREAILEQNLFNYNNNFYMLQIIDTPGFGDSTKDSRTDFEQEELILKFVKKGVTSLNLVLVTVKYGVRLEASQIETIMSVLRFLGRGMCENACVLCTHSEGTTQEDRVKWLKMAMDSQLKDLLVYCKKKVFFTGMAIHGNETDKEISAKNLRQDQLKIVQFAVKSTPISLSGEEYDNIGNQFKLYESAAKDSLTLKKLLPEIPDLARTVEKTKNSLVGIITELSKYIKDEEKIILIKEEVELILKTLANFNPSKIQEQVQEWSKLQSAVADYIERGAKVQESANTVREQYTFMIKQKIILQRKIDEITLFGDLKESELDNDTFLPF